MKLFEAILDANRRITSGDNPAGVNLAEHGDALPLAALTCIDARLNPLVPEVFGVSGEQFVWLRNAGNIITGPMSSTLRSLALACAVKGAREIAIVGHTDCRVAGTNAMELTDRFQKLGVRRKQLPENLNDFFGLFASERQNVLKAVEFVCQSPLIGPSIPVHGLLLDIQNGRLEWLVNGYEQPARTTVSDVQVGTQAPEFATDWKPIGHFEPMQSGQMRRPAEEIGAPHKEEAVAAQSQPIGGQKEEEKEIGSSSLLDRARQWASEVQLVDGQSLRETVAQAGRASVATVKEITELIDRNNRYRVIGSDMKEYGPIPGFKLVQWLMEDRITPDSPVRPESGGEWQPLKNLVRGVVKKHVSIPPPLENIASRFSNSLRKNQ